MSSQASKYSKTTKPPNQLSTATTAASSRSSSASSSSLSSHLAMVELKQRILTSLSKLSDRDTHQIAVEDLEKIIQALSQDGVPMLLNCLYEATNDPKTAVKKEAIRLLAFICSSHTESTSTHLTKIISHIVRRLKDSDSSVRDACRDSIGALSSLYLKGDGENAGLSSVVSLFLKPLFEAMSEQNKAVQSGAAMCMARMVDCASDPPVAAFYKMCPRICKYLNNPNFLAKSALLNVVSSLSQAGAIAPQSLDLLLQSIHECLENIDWATRKAAADSLSALALHSTNLVCDRSESTLAVLEACRFDKIKPVRDSVTEALLLWKKIAGKGEDGSLDDQKPACQDGEPSEMAKYPEKFDSKILNPSDRRTDASPKDSLNGISPSSISKTKGGTILDKAVGILKKKAPALTDKELNPEFFQKLETRSSDDLPVEVIVPRRNPNCSDSHEEEEETEPNRTDYRGRSNRLGNSTADDLHGSPNIKYRNIDKNGKDPKPRSFDIDDRFDSSQRESQGVRPGMSKTTGAAEGSFMNNKGNWLAIQRQLLQLERQQAHLMNMFQEFMGGSHDSMVTLENRVRGLERVVEDMARDLSLSSARRVGSNFMMGFEGPTNRTLNKYNGFTEYTPKLGSRSGFATADGFRGRGPPWRSDMADTWDYPFSRNSQIVSSRRALGGTSADNRSPRSDHEGDQMGSRRAWDKGAGPLQLGEGPSARSVWQASKDEATLEAIRVAGEDNETGRKLRIGLLPELTTEAIGDDNQVQSRNPLWNSWTNAMDALQVGDVDSAYAEVLSTGDDFLLVKLMDRSGPVIDQLSNEVGNEVLHAVGQFLMEQNLFDICLSWIQQLLEIVIENGPNALSIPMEVKRELLLNLNEATTTIDPPEEWEGAAPDQLVLQLASSWEIDLPHIEK